MVEDLEAEEASSVVETATLGLEEGSLEAVTEVEVDRVVDSSTATTIQGEEVVVVFSATTTIVTIRVEEGFSTTKTILDQTTQDTSVQVLHRFSSSLLHSHLAFQMKNGMETQVSNQKAQKLIELESLNESEKRDALQKLAFERDIRLQAQLESERYKQEISPVSDAYWSRFTQKHQPPILRNPFAKPLVFNLPSKKLSNSLNDSKHSVSNRAPRSHQIGDPNFELIGELDVPAPLSKGKSFLTSMIPSQPKSMSIMFGSIEFHDHRVYFRTMISSYLSIKNIKLHILQNWWQREKHNNHRLDADPQNFELIFKKSNIDIDGKFCIDPKQKLTNFATTTDLNFDDIRVQVFVKTTVEWMNIQVDKSPKLQVSSYSAKSSTMLPEMANNNRPMSKTEQEMMKDMQKRPDSWSIPTALPSTAQNTQQHTRDKGVHEQPVGSFFMQGTNGPRPAPFTSSLPKGLK